MHNILIVLPDSPTHTLFWFAQTIPISPVHLFFSLNISVFVSFPMFHIFLSQRPHIGPAERPWTTNQKGQLHYLDVQRATLDPIRLSALIHVYPTLPH